MKNKLNILLFASLFLIVGGFFYNQNQPVVASVSQASEYRSTMATSGLASASVARLVQTGQGTLGSVVITSTSATTFTVWDATSTATTTYQTATLRPDLTEASSTTYGRQVAAFKASPGENTYTFDVSLYKGLVLEVPSGFNGSYTVTYR